MLAHTLTVLVALLEGCVSSALPAGLTLERRDNTCVDASGKKSQWVDHTNDGEGRYLGTCSASGSGSHKCWTDVYLYQSSLHWADWQRASDDLDCAAAPECKIVISKGTESCKTWETDATISGGIEAEGISLGVSLTQSEGGSDCSSLSTGDECTWHNKLCHKVMASVQMLHNQGYVRRSCNRPGNGESPRPGDGKYTVGWADWDEMIPTNTWRHDCRYHCDTNPGRRHLPDDTAPVKAH